MMSKCRRVKQLICLSFHVTSLKAMLGFTIKIRLGAPKPWQLALCHRVPDVSCGTLESSRLHALAESVGQGDLQPDTPAEEDEAGGEY